MFYFIKAYIHGMVHVALTYFQNALHNIKRRKFSILLL